MLISRVDKSHFAVFYLACLRASVLDVNYQNVVILFSWSQGCILRAMGPKVSLTHHVFDASGIDEYSFINGWTLIVQKMTIIQQIISFKILFKVLCRETSILWQMGFLVVWISFSVIKQVYKDSVRVCRDIEELNRNLVQIPLISGEAIELRENFFDALHLYTNSIIICRTFDELIRGRSSCRKYSSLSKLAQVKLFSDRELIAFHAIGLARSRLTCYHNHRTNATQQSLYKVWKLHAIEYIFLQRLNWIYFIIFISEETIRMHKYFLAAWTSIFFV